MSRVLGLIGLLVLSSCKPPSGGWGRVTILESRLGPSSWSVLVDDRGQGVDVIVDGARRQAQCRHTSRGRRCWVGGIREGYRRLAVQVGGKGVARRTALSPPPRPESLVIYSLLLDRFADGDRGNNIRAQPGVKGAPQGGDLKGARAHLSFLKWLGVNAVLLSPIWDHVITGRDKDGLPRWVGRQARDPLRLSSAFGHRGDLMRFLATARHKGIRVLLDLPRGRMSLERYFAVVRTWLERTFADGFRLGPVRPGEEADWAAAARALARDFLPLVLIHHGAGNLETLRRALSPLPRAARVLEQDTGRRWLRWLGCAKGPRPRPPLVDERGPAAPVARILSSRHHAVLGRRCKAVQDGEDRVDLALTIHLLTADIPVVYYADGWAEPPGSDPLPVVRWRAAKRTRRHRWIRRLLALRRKVPVLWRGDQRVRVDGETVIVTRRHRRCRAILVIHGGARRKALDVSLTDLGWPAPTPGAAPVELVDRMRGRGVTAEGNRLRLTLEPRSVVVLVPTGHGACSG